MLSALSWRWLFILMLPIAVAALALGAWKLRNTTTPEPVALDVPSLLLSAIGFGGLVYGLSLIGEASAGHSPISPYLPLAVGLAGLVAFVLRQIPLQRRDSAFLDMRIFLRKSFALPILVMVFVAGNGIGLLVVVPLVLTNVTGLSTLQLGLFLIPGGAAISIVSALSGRFYDRFGPRPLVIPGAIVWLAVLWFLSRVDESTSVITLILAWLVFTSAMATMWAPLTTSAMGALRSEPLPARHSCLRHRPAARRCRFRCGVHLGLHHRFRRPGRRRAHHGAGRVRRTGSLHHRLGHRPARAGGRPLPRPDTESGRR